MRRTLTHIRAVLMEGAAPAAYALTRPGRAAMYLARLAVRILKQWARDRCPQQASALAFQTTLSLVPVLAIAFTVLHSAGGAGSEQRLLDFLTAEIFLNADLAEHLRAFSTKITTQAAGASGLLFTFIACYSLYAEVERTFNDVWRVHVRRVLMRKFLTFYALVTLLPILAALYLYWSGRLMSSGPGARFFGPFSIQLVALLLMNKLLPNIGVRWRAAITGALVTAGLLEILKWGFVTFAQKILLTSYTGVYGPVALVPMLLILIYSAWVLVLLGAEVAHALQNLHQLEAEDRRRPGEEPINGFVAIQILAAVAGEHERGGRGLTSDMIAHAFGLSAEIVQRVCERLKIRGLIAEVQGDKQGFIPGRAATAIGVADVLAAFRSTDVAMAEGAISPSLAALMTQIEDDRRARIGTLTVADLIVREAPPGSAPASAS